jgi:hypothetical protein
MNPYAAIIYHPLIRHYEETLGGYYFGGHKMIIPTQASKKLVAKYFKLENYGAY